MLNIPEEVKKLFKTSNVKKNIRISFPNVERADITNENLIAESLSYTESVCSQESLKFGLCESSVLEFETAGIGNIKGMEITAEIEIDARTELPYKGTVEISADGVDYTNYDYYRFDILSLFGEPLPANTNVFFSTDGSCGLAEIYAEGPISDDSIELYEDTHTVYAWSNNFETDFFEVYVPSTYTGKVWASFFEEDYYPIPLGKFIVDSSQKQADMSRRKVTAYGITSSSLYNYSPIEKAKRENPYSIKKDYVMDMEKFFISNIAGDYIPENASMIESTAYSQTDSEHTFYSSSGACAILHSKGIIYTSPIAQQALYYSSCSMTQAEVEEKCKAIKESLSAYASNEWVEATMKTIEKYAYRIFHTNACFHNATGTSSFGSLEGGYRYIYLYHDADFSYGVANIYIPLSIEILHEDGSGTIVDIPLFSEDDAKIYEVMLENPLGITTTIPRTKNGSYYTVTSDLPVLANTIEAFLEFQGRFGIHDRNGDFTTLKLADSFANKTSLSKSEYSDLWYEDKPSYPYGIVSAIYVNENGEESFSCVNIVKDVDILEKVQVATATPTSGTTVSLSFDKADVEGYYIESPYPITGVTLSFEDGPAWIADF